MTQTAKHSPTPWQDNDAGLIYGQVSGDDDEAPFVCDVCDSPLEYTGREKANAAFIVRACNAHRDLIETLEYILGHASMARNHANQKGWLASLENVANAAGAAIAKATA